MNLPTNQRAVFSGVFPAVELRLWELLERNEQMLLSNSLPPRRPAQRRMLGKFSAAFSRRRPRHTHKTHTRFAGEQPGIKTVQLQITILHQKEIHVTGNKDVLTSSVFGQLVENHYDRLPSAGGNTDYTQKEWNLNVSLCFYFTCPQTWGQTHSDWLTGVQLDHTDLT